MFANYLKITLRNLWGSKLYSAINLLGLATGLTATILIGLFVLDELGYDRHYADAERIYRVSRDFPPQNNFVAANAPQVAALLKADFPEIEQAARIFGGAVLLSSEDSAFYEANVRFADNEFFDIFALDWIAGDAAQALTRPFTIVLTESLAMKYFASVDVLGRSLTLENAVPLEVTGVIRDLPHATHLDLGVVVSLSTVGQMLGEGFFEDWGSNNFHTYIKLRPGVAIDTITARFPDFMRRHIADNATEWTGMTALAIGAIHLHSGRQNEMKAPGSIGTLYAFTAAALFILLIACCNFMNLSTARSARRGREVGIRKSLGASRVELARQFVGESLLLALFAMGLALVLAELTLPAFNALIGKELRLVLDVRTIAALLGLVMTVGLVAGSYPAFFLSAFKPAQVLRSLLTSGGGAALRNTLVVLQFTIAIVLVVATLVVGLQLRYARDIDTGFSREQVVVLTGSPTAGLGPQWETLRERLASHPGVLSVTASAQTPLEINTNAASVRAEGEEQGRALPFMRVDYDFFATYEIPLLAGRGFSRDFPADRLVNDSDGAGLVLNRLAAAQYGWTPEEAIGKGLRVFQNGGGANGVIVGVVENSYFESVRADMKPMLFLMPEYITNGEALMHKASIRLSGANLEDTLAHIDATWTEFMPDFPLARAFLDDQFAALFRAEAQQGDVFRYFALLGVVIACLGLYGLASYNAERRTKEIGVRKVMGGSVWSIVLLLTNDFGKLVLISNVLAWPIAYVAMDRWLENFAYRIDLSPLVFIGSGAIALCIAWVTVGGTAAKAASAKPVLALRYE